MSFDKNDPRLTAYVLDEIDDASERAAMDGALEADPELRVLIDELTNASHVLEQALDGSSEADNLLDPDQRANVEARASMALSRRARMRRRRLWWQV